VVAREFNVSLSAVSTIIKEAKSQINKTKAQQLGEKIAPQPVRKKTGQPAKLHGKHLSILLDLIEEQPSATLSRLAQLMQERAQVTLSTSTISCHTSSHLFESYLFFY
jgi:transposase